MVSRCSFAVFIYPLFLVLISSVWSPIQIWASPFADAIDAGPSGGQDLVQEAIKQTAEMMEQIRNLYEAGASASKEVDDGPVMKWHYCKCKNQFCQCCANIKIKPFGLNDQICVNAGYIPSELAVAVNVSWDGKVIISDKLSARNPPEVCAEIPIPKIEDLLSFCLKFYNVEISGDKFQSCFEIKLAAFFVPIFTIHLGCVHFGSIENNWSCAYSHEDTSALIESRYSCVARCDGVVYYQNSSSLLTTDEDADSEFANDAEVTSDTKVRKDYLSANKRYSKGQCEFVPQASDPENICLVGCVPSNYGIKRF